MESLAYSRPALGLLGQVSALGVGTALGDPTDHEDELYEDALAVAVECGITLVDTAINYRCQMSERAVGRAVRKLGDGARPLVCTKSGYLPLEAPPPESKDEYRAYIQREYIDSGIIDPGDLVAGGHCIAPGFLTDQIRRSLSNLQIDVIDLYYVHNPAQQLDSVPRDVFEVRLRNAFAALEGCVDEGHIRAYGCATWHALRVAPDAPNHLSLESLLQAARDVAGDSHHFAAVQIPINLAMVEAVRVPTQLVSGRPRTALEAADELGVAVIAVAPLLQGRLTSGLPAAARDAFPEAGSDAECALAFVGMLPHVTSVVVGMRSAKHVRENSALFA